MLIRAMNYSLFQLSKYNCKITIKTYSTIM
jgi:hypothetical protein